MVLKVRVFLRFLPAQQVNHAIGEAYLNILHGYSDAIVAGGAEASINPLSFAGFSRMRAMSTLNDSPEKASRPFDQ